ncbi:50S ribosomal protein L37ae [Candidatus Woesearchaeota archaeon]|nr:50S ribosomal protein L37ae [Candidatus Woesearchaeota archaeon]
MATKKVGAAGRFGVRYGRTIRKKVAKVEERQRRWQKCPYCTKLRVKRLSAGIWQCRFCDKKFTNHAYEVVL